MLTSQTSPKLLVASIKTNLGWQGITVKSTSAIFFAMLNARGVAQRPDIYLK